VSTSGWVGVDLDGTLAHYGGWTGGIGEPIQPMVELVKKLLAEGTEVRIFTARVAATGLDVPGVGETLFNQVAEQTRLIQDWCEKHIGQRLHVTATKDFACIQIYDDRAIQVEFNTGRIVNDVVGTQRNALHEFVNAASRAAKSNELKDLVRMWTELGIKHQVPSMVLRKGQIWVSRIGTVSIEIAGLEPGTSDTWGCRVLGSGHMTRMSGVYILSAYSLKPKESATC